jgi:Bacterial SH3 domain
MKLPKIETLIVLVFFGCVVLWAVSKCSGRRAEIGRRVKELAEETEERPIRRDTVFVPASGVTAPAGNVPQLQPSTTSAPAPVTSSQATPQATPKLTKPVLQKTPAATAPAPSASAPAAATGSKYSTLFVTIDGLKVRKTPSLKGELVAKLELYEPVTFLNKKSEKAEEISLGYEKVTDHWVKIRTREGKEGWVFGAGVHYYKMKRKGVLE